MDILPLGNSTVKAASIRYNYNERLSASTGAAASGTDSFEYSASVSVEALLYTGQGVLNVPAAASTASDTSAETAATDTEAASLDDFSNYKARFLEIIRNRVAYLLNALVNGDNTGDSIPAIGINTTEDVSGVDLGYWSPEQTAARIVNFALSFYDGGDRSEYADMVREAVLKGYEEALGTAGGSLPGVADETISLVMDAIDRFENGTGFDLTA